MNIARKKKSTPTVLDIINLDNCVVRDENGITMAKLEERGLKIIVHKMPACSIGVYLYIISYLCELGFDAQ